ncbi:MAG: hypothetical protein A2172_00750 [Candidatus Woykebacteria bacterium RBG_13_40_15]|uniref:Uncharacterized protein n=1 Tax=Candidatus Woykebacteria bacterium RBG_13_40_15 TaxID=1802593 RepID=A0A1G1W8R6_9BACT|nr:MAG: hypothetical protein A2172_00750 [Candidatus Woykebacteria bacterium RBG_13_40_15]
MKIELFNLTKINLENLNFDFLTVLFLSFVLGMYLIFSFLVYKQVRVLNKNIQTNTGIVLDALSLANLLGAVVIFIFAVSLLIR